MAPRLLPRALAGTLPPSASLSPLHGQAGLRAGRTGASIQLSAFHPPGLFWTDFSCSHLPKSCLVFACLFGLVFTYHKTEMPLSRSGPAKGSAPRSALGGCSSCTIHALCSRGFPCPDDVLPVLCLACCWESFPPRPVKCRALDHPHMWLVLVQPDVSPGLCPCRVCVPEPLMGGPTPSPSLPSSSLEEGTSWTSLGRTCEQ